MIKIKNLKLGVKLSIAFLAIGVLPALTISWIALSRASDSLSQQAFQQLESVREIKKTQIENLLAKARRDMDVMINTQAIISSLAALENWKTRNGLLRFRSKVIFNSNFAISDFYPRNRVLPMR